MIKKLIIFTIFFLFLGVNFVSADSPPILLSPINNSTITQTSPKLSWDYSGECYTKGSCYYVEIDNSETFSSIDKSTYTSNKFYTPKNLSYGKWFWHVKAKNPSGIWSTMSDTLSFTIVDTPSTPSPTPTATPSPTHNPTLSPNSSSTYRPTNAPTSKPSFTSTPSPNPTNNPPSRFSAYAYLKNRANQATISGQKLQDQETREASIAAVTSTVTKPNEIAVKSDIQANLIRITGLLFILLGSGVTTYILLRSRIKSKIL